jgi:hypothetical protein
MGRPNGHWRSPAVTHMPHFQDGTNMFLAQAPLDFHREISYPLLESIILDWIAGQLANRRLVPHVLAEGAPSSLSTRHAPLVLARPY